MLPLSPTQVRTLEKVLQAPGGELPSKDIDGKKYLIENGFLLEQEVETPAGEQSWCRLTEQGARFVAKLRDAKSAFRK